MCKLKCRYCVFTLWGRDGDGGKEPEREIEQSSKDWLEKKDEDGRQNNTKEDEDGGEGGEVERRGRMHGQRKSKAMVKKGIKVNEAAFILHRNLS